MKKHIELFGLPGAGKTTVYKTLLSLAGQQRKRVYTLDEAVYEAMKTAMQSRYDRILLKWLPYRIGNRFIKRFPRTPDDLLYVKYQRFLLQHRELARIFQRYQAEESLTTDDLGLLVFLWSFELFAKFQLIADEWCQDGIVILDEGFCQRAVSLFGYGKREDRELLQAEIEAYVDNIPLPDAVVRPVASIESVLSRMERRGVPLRMRSLTRVERLNVLEHVDYCLHVTVKRLQQRNVEIIEIENEGPQAEVVASTQQAVRHILDRSRGSSAAEQEHRHNQDQADQRRWRKRG